MTTQTIHVICTSQVHSCGNISDSQINSVSESLSASANYLRKLVEGTGNTSSTLKKETKNEDKVRTETTTVSVHADSSYGDVLKGFTTYDSKDVNTDAYSVKRQAYDTVRQKYPNLDDLLRDEKVQAMKELRSVGFKYYSIQVTAIVEIDGMTKTVSSKSHHRLERPSKDYLETILKDTFKGTVRVEEKTSEPSNDSAEEESSESKVKDIPDNVNINLSE